MIIDCHGHFTTTPAAHEAFREDQLAWLANPQGPPPAPGAISVYPRLDRRLAAAGR